MINKKVLCGIALGLLGSKLYPKARKNMKPITKKILKTEENQDELKILEEEHRRAFCKIAELKRQLEDISKKVNNL